MTTKKTTKKTTQKDIWNTLSKINVNQYLQQKGKYPYLPWGDAWKIMMENYPDVTFENEYNDDGYPVFYDPQGRGMVRVSVMVCGFTHTEDYMITNYSNQCVENPNPALVNNCLKRALVKCMAYFGLGSYLYNQEDMAEVEEEVVEEVTPEYQTEGKATKEQISIIEGHFVFSDNEDLEKQTLAWASNKTGIECKTVSDLPESIAATLVSKYAVVKTEEQ
tara:strand:- start:4699 stop:5358 length:660 start_codon:yes stop_codon:yes gene_type:complete